MDSRIVKAGWVYKRSEFLKQWRKRWLVLRESTLCTYKTKDLRGNPTMNLNIPEITEAVASVLEFERDFCFKVVSLKDYFMTVESDKELCIWLNLINHIRLGRSISVFDAPHYSREVKAQSDESLITSFSHTKALINEREEWLIKQLADTYQLYKTRAEEEHKILSESLALEMENCQIVGDSLRSDFSVLQKIQQIQKLTKMRQKFMPFDNINESKLQISIDPDVITKVLRPNIKVMLKSQGEIMVRRTKFTRALKWRYTGTRIDALTFAVSHDIELLGVGICGPYKQGGQIIIREFQILRGNSSNSSVIYKTNSPITIKFSQEDHVHKISIDSQVVLKAESKYTVFFAIDGSHTFKCVDCESVIEGQATWKFFNTIFAQSHQTNRCDTTCGPIADFYYSLS